MPDQPDDITRLRKTCYSLEDLPDTITIPQHPVDDREPLLLADATIDDIAFAIVAAEQESTTAYRRSNALQRLYKLAREGGGIGADRAVATAIKREGR